LKTIVVTGSSGLVGSSCARLFLNRGFQVLGIDNGMRREFFGEDGNNESTRRELVRASKDFHPLTIDIREMGKLRDVFVAYGRDILSVIHCAGQPSHDWAAKDPHIDFTVNALGTLNLLELTKVYCPQASFVFMSTNKVYGDKPNDYPVVEMPTRYILPGVPGFSETLGLDDTTHSLFGASKASADLLVQEYGRYFGLHTTCLRAGCITGGAHAGAEQHGFLSYLVKCCASGHLYNVYGYKGKQVRDNIHADDLAEAIYAIAEDPTQGEVYNIGGEADNSISVLEAINWAEQVTGKKMNWEYKDEARKGDHIWYVSDMSKFRQDFPNWKPTNSLHEIFEDIARGVA
jgi:CDP-paratose 2-epimerase